MSENMTEKLFGLSPEEMEASAERKLGTINLTGVDREDLKKEKDELERLNFIDGKGAVTLAKKIIKDVARMLKGNEEALSRAAAAATLVVTSKISWEGGGGVALADRKGVSVTGRDGGDYHEVNISEGSVTSSSVLSMLTKNSSYMIRTMKNLEKNDIEFFKETMAQKENRTRLFASLPQHPQKQGHVLSRLASKMCRGDWFNSDAMSKADDLVMSWLNAQTEGALTAALRTISSRCESERGFNIKPRDSKESLEYIFERCERFSKRVPNGGSIRDKLSELSKATKSETVDWREVKSSLAELSAELEKRLPRGVALNIERLEADRVFQDMPLRMLDHMIRDVAHMGPMGFMGRGFLGGGFDPMDDEIEFIGRGVGDLESANEISLHMFLLKAQVLATEIGESLSKATMVDELDDETMESTKVLIDVLGETSLSIAECALREWGGWLRDEGLSEDAAGSVLKGAHPLDLAFAEKLKKGPAVVWEKLNQTYQNTIGLDLNILCGLLGMDRKSIEDFNKTDMGEALAQVGRDLIKSNYRENKNLQVSWALMVSVLIQERKEPSSLSEMARENGWESLIMSSMKSQGWNNITGEISNFLWQMVHSISVEGKLTEAMALNLKSFLTDLNKEGRLRDALRDLHKNKWPFISVSCFKEEKAKKKSSADDHEEVLKELSKTEEPFRVALVRCALMAGKTNIEESRNKMLADGMEHAMSITGLNKKALVSASRNEEVWKMFMKEIEGRSKKMEKELMAEARKGEKNNAILKDCVETTLRRELPIESAAVAAKAIAEHTLSDISEPMASVTHAAFLKTLERYVKEGRTGMDFLDDFIAERAESKRMTKRWREEVTQWAAHLLTEVGAKSAKKDLVEALGRVDDWRQAETGRFMKGLGGNFTWRNLHNGESKWHERISNEEGMVVGASEWAPIIGQLTKGTLEAVELSSERMLVSEGRAMHHCVGGYAHHCKAGMRIFSIREDGRRLTTLSLNRKGDKFTINQNLASYNRDPSRKAQNLAAEVLNAANERLMAEKSEKLSKSAYRLTSSGDVDPSAANVIWEEVEVEAKPKIEKKKPKMC